MSLICWVMFTRLFFPVAIVGEERVGLCRCIVNLSQAQAVGLVEESFVETGTAYDGLAINLTDVTGAWGDWKTEDAKYYSTHTQDMSQIATFKDGIAQTNKAPEKSMAKKCSTFDYKYNENS